MAHFRGEQEMNKGFGHGIYSGSKMRVKSISHQHLSTLHLSTLHLSAQHSASQHLSCCRRQQGTRETSHFTCLRQVPLKKKRAIRASKTAVRDVNITSSHHSCYCEECSGILHALNALTADGDVLRDLKLW